MPLSNDESGRVDPTIPLSRGDMYEWEGYERQFARRVLDNVKAVKKARKMTTAELSVRLREVGWPTTVNSLNGMLASKGRATVTVTETVAFAEALGVPPLELVFGNAYDPMEYVWASFRYERTRRDARAIFTGLSALAATPFSPAELLALTPEQRIEKGKALINAHQPELSRIAGAIKEIGHIVDGAELELAGNADHVAGYTLPPQPRRGDVVINDDGDAGIVLWTEDDGTPADSGQ